MSASRSADMSLAHRCVSGERAAQRELFEAQRRHVHATLYRIVGSNLDMEDLIQDAFIAIFRSLEGFRGEALLRTWIDRITVRVAYAHVAQRRAGPHLELVSPEMASGDPSAERRVLAREAARRLYALLDGIEPKQRVAYTLAVVDGRPLHEVAEIMETSVMVTKARVWRARRLVEKRIRHDPLFAGLVHAEGEE